MVAAAAASSNTCGAARRAGSLRGSLPLRCHLPPHAEPLATALALPAPTTARRLCTRPARPPARRLTASVVSRQARSRRARSALGVCTQASLRAARSLTMRPSSASDVSGSGSKPAAGRGRGAGGGAVPRGCRRGSSGGPPWGVGRAALTLWQDDWLRRGLPPRQEGFSRAQPGLLQPAQCAEHPAALIRDARHAGRRDQAA